MFFFEKYHKKILGFIFIILSLSNSTQAQTETFTFPDFDKAFMRYELTQLTPPNHESTLRHADPFKIIYNNMISHFTVDPSTPYRIPPCVHQIWLGSPVPEKYKKWMTSWMNLQGWQYKLWTDKDVENLNMHNRALYNSAKNYGEKADILRCEILLQEGGIYVDTDFELLNPQLLDQFNKSFDFYMGFEPMEHVPDYERVHGIHIKLSNAFIASIPNHPILKKLVFDLADNCSRQTHTVNRTGPNYVTKVVTECITSIEGTYLNLFCPSTFLCPLTYFDEHATQKPDLTILIRPESAAIHHWAASWTK